jgi:DNA invertase Pin-like site-specific DNA recombinase
MILERLLAIRVCLDYTKQHEKIFELKLLKDYAASKGFTVAQEYVDVETAKQTGRTAFGEMVLYLKAHPSVRVMLVEKTDRLSPI